MPLPPSPGPRSDIQVVDASGTDRTRWNDYVARRADASAFHWYGWRDALGGVLGYDTRWFMALRGDTVCGVLPVAAVKSRLWGVSVCSLPFCSYGGTVADDDDVARALEDAAHAFAQAAGAPRMELRHRRMRHPDWPRQDLYVTFTRAIPDGLDELKGIPQKRRNMVRRAVSNGLTARVAPDVDAFFHLYAENARAHGTPALPRRFFEVLLPALGDRADILFVLDKTGRPVSGILNLLHGDSLHAGFAGELPAARELAANDFKYWKLMQHARDRGCTVFDFGRSKRDTGSYQFKRLWGHEPEPLHYEFLMPEGGTIPQNNPNNPKFQLVMKVWSRLPRAVVDRVGPRVIHGLG